MIQDESTTTYSTDKMNTVWIDGNDNTVPVGSSTYYNTANPNGYYGGYSAGNGGVSISGTTATINVFIPANPISTSTYLYLRLAIPMDTEIAFGKVTASISS
jgi:hypothetical protein